MENDAIDPQDIRDSHGQATIQRVAEEPLVLVAQDTTYLKFANRPHTKGLGPIGTNPKKSARGMLMHSSLAMTSKGLPLGFLHTALMVRETNGKAPAKRRPKRSPAQKESQKWIESIKACQEVARECPNTTIINIADREGDIYEALAQATSVDAPTNAHVLVRSMHNRKLDEQPGKLWDAVSMCKIADRYSVQLRCNKGKRARKAKMVIRYCAVRLRPPAHLAHLGAVEVWAVLAEESGAPKGVTPLCWRLLSTFPINTPKEARQCVNWYAQRWQIEVFHKVLKSVCRFEQRQLKSEEKLERMLALDQVVAWRIMALTIAAREIPDSPVDQWLTPAQWKALCCATHRRKSPPEQPPGVKQAVEWIAGLGGHLGRRNDGPPGPITLWRGFERLNDLARMWELMS